MVINPIYSIPSFNPQNNTDQLNYDATAVRILLIRASILCIILLSIYDVKHQAVLIDRLAGGRASFLEGIFYQHILLGLLFQKDVQFYQLQRLHTMSITFCVGRRRHQVCG